MSNQEYVPGVCNIGTSEIKQRKRVGWIGLVLTIIIWVGIGLLHLPKPWLFILFIPATASATGFIQAYTHFCAGFGMNGVFNFGSEVGKTDTVMQQEFRVKDKRKAFQIILYSVVIGLVVTAIALIA